MPESTTPSADLDFDADALRAKYRHERDRRIRPEGNAQYQRAAGKFGYYMHDPYTERVERDPLNDRVETLVVGGGFGGLMAGARLREAGFESIRMMDEAATSAAPGTGTGTRASQCDIESYVYLPLLEEIGYIPK